MNVFIYFVLNGLQACGSVSGFITNDYQNKISFLSTRLPIDSHVSSLLKQAAIRSLSCEVVPGREGLYSRYLFGQIYFGDSVCGHVLSNTFFLKDAQARGFHRWYSILVFMKDKHFLLNSWNFFQQCINQIVLTLKRQTVQVYSNEQNARSQRAFRLSSLDQRHSTARSLMKLTASTKVFSQLHLWFTWLLSMAAKRLEEHIPPQVVDSKAEGSFEYEKWKPERVLLEYQVRKLRELYKTLGVNRFQKILYSTVTGQQVVIRGPALIVEEIVQILQCFLPARKFRYPNYGFSYKTPDVGNIIGLDLSAAVPKSTDKILRLDVVPLEHLCFVLSRPPDWVVESSIYYYFVKTEQKLPEKLPTFLIKMEKALADKSLTNEIVRLRLKFLAKEWIHMAEVIRELRKTQHKDLHAMTSQMQSLGVQEQDYPLIEFWSS